MLPDQESMIAQVIVSVVDEDAEYNAPEEFGAIAVSIGTLGLQQIDQFQIARAGLAACDRIVVPEMSCRHFRARAVRE